jgi:hypothetical protein
MIPRQIFNKQIYRSMCIDPTALELLGEALGLAAPAHRVTKLDRQNSKGVGRSEKHHEPTQ